MAAILAVLKNLKFDLWACSRDLQEKIHVYNNLDKNIVNCIVLFISNKYSTPSS